MTNLEKQLVIALVVRIRREADSAWSRVAEGTLLTPRYAYEKWEGLSFSASEAIRLLGINESEIPE